MSRLFLIFVCVAVTINALAQAPEKMSYQAVVRNQSGELVKNQSVGVLVSISEDAFFPKIVYQETHTKTTNENGLLTLEIGGGTVVENGLSTYNFSTIKWGEASFKVNVSFDLSGGTNYSLSSSSKLLSVPYALYAKSAGNSTGGAGLPTATTPGQLLYWTGESWSLITPSTDGKVLGLENGIPVWKDLPPQTVISTPTVSTNTVSSITVNQAYFSGYVLADGGSAVAERGFCYGTSQNPTIQDNIVPCGNGLGSFNALVPGLKHSTWYDVRTYATNSAGTVYGNQQSFKTTELFIPTLTTKTLSSIGYTSAISGGDISSDGGADVTARGVVWSTLPNPTTDLSTKTTDGAGIGAYVSTLSGLAPGTSYYVRSYASNEIGTSYGNEITFTSKALALPALLSYVGYFTQSKIVVESNVTDGGGSPVTERGIVWSTSENPTLLSGTKIQSGYGEGTYESTLTGLTPNTKYYIKAYATNSMGTTYSSPMSCTTLALAAPTVTTAAVSDVKGNSAKANGNISQDGGSEVISMGLCWSTGTNPTTADNKTTSFTDVMSGLVPNTTYYVRAYAQNSTGTGYGNQVSFNSGKVIGTSHAGGLVFYNDGSGHGMVCAATDQSTGTVWGCYGAEIYGAEGISIGTGSQNTVDIENDCYTPGTAADICAKLVLGEYSNWFLPSKKELNELYLNKDVLGGFTSGFYWSSSEYNSMLSWEQSFENGSQNMSNKTNSNKVRAIRIF